MQRYYTVGLIPDRCNKGTITIKWLTWHFWLPSTYKTSVYTTLYSLLGFPAGTSGKGPTCQWRRHERCGFNPRVRKVHWMRNSNLPSILAWRIPWAVEPGGLQSIGLQSWTRLSKLACRHIQPITCAIELCLSKQCIPKLNKMLYC